MIVERVRTDNGSCYRRRELASAMPRPRPGAQADRPCRPQTNGKVERFYRTVTAGWAFRRLYSKCRAPAVSTLDAGGVGPDVELRVRFKVNDNALTELHQLAFGTGTGPPHTWQRQLERHSLTWVGAFAAAEALIGFVNVAWDGATHAFILDTAVRPGEQRRGIGHRLVRTAAAEAAAAGCRWLHVDYEPHLERFYRDRCGLRHTDAALLPLR